MTTIGETEGDMVQMDYVSQIIFKYPKETISYEYTYTTNATTTSPTYIKQPTQANHSINNIKGLMIFLMSVVFVLCTCIFLYNQSTEINTCHKAINNLNESITNQFHLINEINQTIKPMANHYHMTTTKLNYIHQITKMPQLEPCGDDHINLNTMQIYNPFVLFARGVLIWHDEMSGNLKQSINRNIIARSDSSLTLNIGDCLQIQNSLHLSNWLELKLSKRIIPHELVYIHVDKNKIPLYDRNMAPKQFRVFVKTQKQWKPIGIKNNKPLNMNESKIELQLIGNEPIQYVRIEYDINMGAKYTRLYRFRIHGSVVN